ncbi:hypothetical protein V1477_016053 [Vespula maculifrons]|uniref:Uncharacterized protein n=1 Tax=Vespula maculifrons TaxID=7453 RepID=A0ABD2BBX5_VESMC
MLFVLVKLHAGIVMCRNPRSKLCAVTVTVTTVAVTIAIAIANAIAGCILSNETNSREETFGSSCTLIIYKTLNHNSHKSLMNSNDSQNDSLLIWVTSVSYDNDNDNDVNDNNGDDDDDDDDDDAWNTLGTNIITII